ncbi:MAG: hypothetical protein K2H41_04370 [Acetatifactor sp.]|nr:hypothetical protein [Acetatifactor sp.]
MLRKYIVYVTSFLFILSLGLSACDSKRTSLHGKYLSAYEGGKYYYDFVDGENYTTNKLWIESGIKDFNDSGTGTYIIDDNKIITYVNGDEHMQNVIGYIYKNYIGNWWEGEFPDKNNKTAKITLTFFEHDYLTYQFKEDKTYEYTVFSYNEAKSTEVGTYAITGDIITCTNENNEVTTFLNTKDGVFCIEYIKE